MTMKRINSSNVLFTLTHPSETDYMKEMEAYFNAIYFAN